MALLTISGDPASQWEEVAHAAASLLDFELVTESRLSHWLAEEFGPAAVPERAWKQAAASVLARLATKHHLAVAFDGAQSLFPPTPLLLNVRITASDSVRAGHVMLDERLEKPEALARLAALDAAAKRALKHRFGRIPREPFDLTVTLGKLDAVRAAEAIASAVRPLTRMGFLSPSVAEKIRFESHLRLARLGIAPANSAHVKEREFGHASEEMFARLLDFYRISWEYEPRSFPLQWDKDGNVIEAFTPDFYLPEFDLYVELTTMKQSLVTKKNRKVKLLRAIYPHVNIQVFYQKDYQDLVFKYGLKAS